MYIHPHWGIKLYGTAASLSPTAVRRTADRVESKDGTEPQSQADLTALRGVCSGSCEVAGAGSVFDMPTALPDYSSKRGCTLVDRGR